MNNKRDIIKLTTLLLLLTFTINAVAANAGKNKKNSPIVNYKKIEIIKPATTLEQVLYKYPTDIPPIYELEYDNFSAMPQEYEDNWSNVTIDPYKVSLKELLKDTIRVNTKNYTAPATGKITSDWGFRRSIFHYGIDIKVYTRDTIRAAFDGTVRITRYNRGGYGYFVVITHDNGLETLYGHLSKILVKGNTKVKSGEAIGMGGNTGRSTGSHLHLEFRYLGVPINPHDVADFSNHRENSDILFIDSNTFAYKKEVDKIRYWTIRSGDSLGRIAYRTGVSISKLCRLNGIKSTTILRIGQRIRYT